LGRKAPSPEKKKAVSEDQEGCGLTRFTRIRPSVKNCDC